MRSHLFAAVLMIAPIPCVAAEPTPIQGEADGQPTTEWTFADVEILSAATAVQAPDGADPAQLAATIAAIDAAGTALRAGRAEDAARAFGALRASVGWPEASYGQALALAKLGRLEEARAAAVEAARGRPEEATFRFVEGALQQAAMRHNDATQAFAIAARQAERQGQIGLAAMAELARAESLRQLGDTTNATAALKRGEALARQTSKHQLVASALEKQALLLTEAGRVSEAQARRKEAQALVSGGTSDVSALHLALAEGQRKLRFGDRAGAEAELETARLRLAAVPGALGQAQALCSFADLQHQLGQAAEARVNLDESERLARSTGLAGAAARPLLVRAAWSLAEGDPAGAARSLAAARVPDEKQVPILAGTRRLLLAQVAQVQGRWEDGLGDAAAAASLFGAAGAPAGQLGADRVRARILAGSGRGADAVDVLARALSTAAALGPEEEADVRAELVERLAASGEAARAMAELDAMRGTWLRASAISRVRARHELVRALLAAGQRAQAEAVGRAGWAEASAAHLPAPLLDTMARAWLEGLLATGRDAEAKSFAAQRGLSAAVGAALDAHARGRAYSDAVAAYEAGRWEDAERLARTLAAAAGLTDEERRAASRVTAAAAVARAGAALDSGAFAPAATAAQVAAEAAVAAMDARTAAEAHVIAAVAATELGRWKDAAGSAELAARQAEIAGDASLRGRALLARGDALFDNDERGAIAAYTAALAAFSDDASYVDARARGCFNLAALLVARGEAKAAEPWLKEAKRLAVAAGLEDLATEADGLARAAR